MTREMSRDDWIKERWGELNKDQQTRDIILGIEHQKAFGGVTHFVGLSLEKLEELIKGNFLRLDEKQNSAPTIQQFYEFMKRYPQIKAHGYAVDKQRGDYRVS